MKVVSKSPQDELTVGIYELCIRDDDVEPVKSGCVPLIEVGSQMMHICVSFQLKLQSDGTSQHRGQEQPVSRCCDSRCNEG